MRILRTWVVIFALASLLLPMSGRGKTQCENSAMLTQRLSCYIQAAQAAGDPAVCLESPEPSVRFNCISLYAEHNEAPAACSLIEADEAQRPHLRAACVSGVAVANRNPALCATVEQPLVKDTCYSFLVLEQGMDKALCENIENKALQEACNTPKGSD